VPHANENICHSCDYDYARDSMPSIIAKELSSTEDIILSGDREVECPECGDTCRVEPDANYKYACEGCGAPLKCQTVI